jgi:hypothetical protein
VLFGMDSNNTLEPVQQTTTLYIMDNREQQKLKAEKFYLGKKVILDMSKQEVGYADGNVFLESSLPKGTRLLRPDSRVTMDNRSDRMNLMINEDNIVKEVFFV